MQTFDPKTRTPGGLTGSQVQIGVFDEGVDNLHEDLRSRVLANVYKRSPHGTHVAGIIAGDGTMSDRRDSWGLQNQGQPYQFRGIAPRANLLNISQWTAHERDVFVSNILKHGMDLSNHSYAHTYDGAYTDKSQLIDAIIRGGAEVGLPAGGRLQVYAAGNFGLKAKLGWRQIGYFSLATQVKNALVVGNYDDQNDRISRTSSLGPTHDGRIKPDLVAPGERVISTAFCSVPGCKDTPPGATFRRNWYTSDSGSSMAAAAVTGGLALVLEQYAATYGIDLDSAPPLPSSLRAVAIHSARDIEGPIWFHHLDYVPVQAFRGPDFVTGWGMLDVLEAVRTVERRELVESALSTTCDSVLYLVQVEATATMRVTLAWDDVPFAGDSLSLDPRLVNDLDLVAVSPAGFKHRPWLLDQVATDADGTPVADQDQVCGQPLRISRQALPAPPDAEFGIEALAGRLLPAGRGRDHLNNVEQVHVEMPEPGTWAIWVIGFNLSGGPQTFSLVKPSAAVPPEGAKSNEPSEVP